MKSLDEIFQLLNLERRRFALYYLEESGRPVPVEELAEVVTEWEADPTPAVAHGHDEFDDVALSLVHQHLPKAAEAEFVEYDREEGVVRLTGTPAEFDVVLSVSKAIEQPGSDGVRRLRDII